MSATQVFTAHRQAKQQQTLHLPPKTTDSQSPKAATTATVPESPFLRIPPEIRIMIYDHLLGSGSENNEIHIRNRERQPVSRAVVTPGASSAQQKQRRTSYYVLERTIMRRGYETTYIHHHPPTAAATSTTSTTTTSNTKAGTEQEAGKGKGTEKGASQKREIHPSILSVNKLIHHEASQRLYARSAFVFAADVEALVPFLSDLTPRTRSLVREISLRKRGGASAGACASADSDAGEWARLCAYLAGQRREGVMRLRRLDVVVEGGKPRCGISSNSGDNSGAQGAGHGNGTWEGPKELSVSDLRLLYATRHDSMEWVRDLAGAGRFFAGEAVEEEAAAAVAEEVRVRASLAPVAEPKTNAMLVHAAFSGSIETALVDFLRELGVPATSALREW